MRSVWLLKLGIVSAVHLKAFSRAKFPSFLGKKELFGAGYLLVWYNTKTIIHLIVGEEW